MPGDWGARLNETRAMSNIRTDITNDWYRDPWGWPEYDYLLADHRDWLSRRARATGIRHSRKIDVPKENFGIRPAIVMDPLDRLLYQSLVDTVSKGVIGRLPEWVFGWRLGTKKTEAGAYLDQGREWASYRRYLNTASVIKSYGLKTDIISCFASIPINRLCEQLDNKIRTRNRGPVNRLIDMLSEFDRVPERSGLQQRSMASAALANMYLEQLNTVINDYTSSGNSRQVRLGATSAVRWMDDIWAFGGDEGALRSFQVSLQEALRTIGLEMNLGKTALYGEDALRLAVAKIEHSAIDAAIKSTPPDVEPLEELLDRLLASPEKSDRTSIRFATVRVRRQRLETRLEQIVSAVPKMPHGADHLARVFRDFGMWRTHADWFLEYIKSPWGISWSVAQIGTMFPTKELPPRGIIDSLGDFLTSGPQFPLFAWSAQRLSSWAPQQALEIFRELSENMENPQERRVIGLASAQAGADEKFIRKVLGEYEENLLTLALLEDHQFSAIEPVPDFSPDENEDS
jgi:hypothetical protein